MKRFVFLVIVAAFTQGGASAQSNGDEVDNPNNPIPKFAPGGPNTPLWSPSNMLDDETVVAILFPSRAAVAELFDRTGLSEHLRMVRIMRLLDEIDKLQTERAASRRDRAKEP
jgi:hypothetical protein